MKFKYVDIGCCDFETSLDHRLDSDKILLIDPLFIYLKNLPDTENIFKFCGAISDISYYSKIYYIKPEDIVKYNLPSWVRGCNSLDVPHKTVVSLLKNIGIDLNCIYSQSVRCVDFMKIVYLYDITEIDTIKIDTEGHDHIILQNMIFENIFDELNVRTIKFEYIKEFGNTEYLDKCIKTLLEMGYINCGLLGDNMTLLKDIN